MNFQESFESGKFPRMVKTSASMGKVQRDATPLPLQRDRLRKWVRVQKAAIEEARLLTSEAREAGDRKECFRLLVLRIETQSELLTLVGAKKATGRPKVAAEPESEAEDGVSPI